MLAGRFRIIGSLGEGGQGEVLDAVDTWRADEPVAIKRVPPAALATLAAEFLALRSLRHEALVEAIDLFEETGPESAAYLVETRIEGTQLLAWAREHGGREVLAVVAPVAHALGHLHARGLVHLDPSPRNILVIRGEEPRAVLIDLGLARPQGQPGAAGTSGFMAPEVLAGEPATAAADIYALAAAICVAFGAAVPQPWEKPSLDPMTAALPTDIARTARELVSSCLIDAAASRPDALTLARRLAELGGVDQGPLMRPQAVVPLCGRGAEVDTFRRWLDGTGSVSRIVGARGMGKTALLDKCADQARLAGFVVLRLTADDPGAAYELARQAVATLSGASTDGGPGSRDDSLRVFSPAGAAPRAHSAQELGELLVLGLDNLVGSSPVLIVIDDADAPPPELGYALSLWRQRRAANLRIAIASASPAIPPERAITLGPLGDEGVREMLHLAFAEPRPETEAEHLATVCGRTPAALMAGLAALAAADRTVFELTPEDMRLASHFEPPRGFWPLALCRGPFSAEILHAVVGRGPEVDTHIADTLRVGFLELVRPGSVPQYRVPAAVRTTLPATGDWVRSGHLVLAHAFMSQKEPLRAAPHWAAGGETERAAGCLRQPGQALPAELLRAFGDVADAEGAFAFDADMAERWAILAGEAGDCVGAARAVELLEAGGRADGGRLALATAEMNSGQYSVALQTLGRVTTSPRRAAVMATALFRLGRTKEAHATAAGTWRDAAGRARADLLDVLGHAAFGLGEVEEAVETLERAFEEAVEIGDPQAVGRAQHSLAIVLHRTGELERALQLYRDAVASASGLATVVRLLNLATVLQDLGDLGEARSLYRRAHSRAVALANAREQARIGVNLANLEVLLGELALGSRLAAETLELCEDAGLMHAAGMAALVLADAALERQAPDEAARALERAATALSDIEDPVAEAERHLLWARLHAAMGETDAAREDLERISEETGAAHIARCRAYWTARLGLLAPTGPNEESRAAAQRAIALSAGANDLELHWRATVVHHRLLQQNGDPQAGAAREAAEQALADWRGQLAEELHAAYFSTTARRQLVRWVERAQPSVMAFSTLAPHDAQLKRLTSINRRLAREEEVQALLELIVDTAIELLGAERGFLILRDATEVRVAVARNFDRRSLQEDGSQRFSRSIATTVLDNGDAVLTTNAQTDERFAAIQSVAALRVRSVICVPLRGTARDEDPLIGALYLDHRFQERAFTEGDVELGEAFADQAAIALENARLFARIRDQERKLALQNERLERYNAQLQKEVATYAEQAETALRRLREEGPTVGVGRGFERFVGRSDKLREALRLIDRFADTDVPVFIFGESGSGKELVAHAVHERSRRSQKPFVSVNCGGIPETLIESELFGYKRGAFTGAVRDKAGLFAAAEGGTLFLDEIGEMPPGMQVKLLRVLQEREYKPVGATRDVAADVRVISASHRNLQEMMAQGTFREDLLYRLQVVEIIVPPLRERREDIPLLVDHFCRRIRHAPAEEVFTQAAIGCFTAHDWPGNVRELENEVQRALALADERVDAKDLSDRLRGAQGTGSAVLANLSRGSLKEIIAGFEREVLLATLKRLGWNVRQAAVELGLSRAAMYTRLTRLNITREADS